MQCCCLLLATVVLATEDAAAKYRVRGSIISNDIITDPALLSTRDAKVMVNGGESTSFIQSDGSFVVENVGLGDSLLEVLTTGYAFPKIHIRIAAKDDGSGASIAARYVQVGSEWSDQVSVLAYPLRIAANEKYSFFTERQGFSIVSMFSNPYMMMVGASLLAVFILPKLQANLDPETLNELQKPSQAKK